MHAQAIGAPVPAADLSEALAALSLVNQAGNQQTAVANDALLQAIERLTTASQRNFQATTEEMGKQSELVAQLKQQLENQADLHQAKEQASDVRIAALEQTVHTLAARVAKQEQEFANHEHKYGACCTHTSSLGYNCHTYTLITQGPQQKPK